MSSHTSNLSALLDQLERLFAAGSFERLRLRLAEAKLLLARQHLLTPAPDVSAGGDDIVLARTILEIGAYTSIRRNDKAGFVTYIGYLQTFYSQGLGGAREAELTGLNLLRLLAENKIAEFHTQLEVIDITAPTVANSDHVKFARGLEEWIMEGAYNRVWKAGEGTLVNVYQKFFLEILMHTIRYYFPAKMIARANPSALKLLLVLNEHIPRYPSPTPKSCCSSPHKPGTISKHLPTRYPPSLHSPPLVNS
jgi:26S proteasome regulatory subunit N12